MTSPRIAVAEIRNEDAASVLKLTAQGYCVTSRAHNLVARIDDPDWESLVAARILRPVADIEKDRLSWADYYRRCVSQDRLLVRSEIRPLLLKSHNGFVEYLPKEKNNDDK